ncbi:treacle protein-like [Pollicipes pollicipes]|uniref:treacle protein-like n=1 Tax=Pollicipes pollicipes TaxID=41117 RepID=UPI0018852323|nr:treacle protein-like [Pollicipes pollicipes]
MAHDEPAGQVATRPPATAVPWSRWPPPAAAASHDQFFSVVKKARPAPAGSAAAPARAGPAPAALAAAGAKPRPKPRAAPGTVPRVALDPGRPRPALAAPKPRMSWDLDLLTEEPAAAGNFAHELEQSPTFVQADSEDRSSLGLMASHRAVPPPSGLFKTAAPPARPARDGPPRSGRGGRAAGQLSAPRKYKKQAANGAGRHVDAVSILNAKAMWMGARQPFHNDLGKVKQKQRRRKEKVTAVRDDGGASVTVWRPQEGGRSTAAPQPGRQSAGGGVSAVKGAAPPQRRPSGGPASDALLTRAEAKPLFEHIDEDWAVIKKSLEKTVPSKAEKTGDAKRLAKASPEVPSQSQDKNTKRLDGSSSDDDFGNDINAPLQNLEKLQQQMIKTLMDEGALNALEKSRKTQKQVHFIKKRKKMSDYWKGKIGGGKGPLPLRIKRPYTVRPLTSDNVKHMEDAIAAVLAWSDGDGGSDRPPEPAAGPPPPPSPSQRAPQLPPAPATAPAPAQTQSQSQTPTRTAVTAPAPAGRQTAPLTAADARLQQVKHDLAARLRSDMLEQEARARAIQLQMAAMQQCDAFLAGGGSPAPAMHRPLIRLRQRRRPGTPHVVRMSESAYLAGATFTDDCLADDEEEDDGLVPPVSEPALPRTMPTAKLKEFLDSARVSRYRRTCSNGLLSSPEMADDSLERMVFVSRATLTPRAPLLDQSLPVDPTAWYGGTLSPDVGWYMGAPSPAGAGWQGCWRSLDQSLSVAVTGHSSPRSATDQASPTRRPGQLSASSVYHEIRLHMVAAGQFRCLGCPMQLEMSGEPDLLDGLLDHYLRHVDGAGRLHAARPFGDHSRCQYCGRDFTDPASYGVHEVRCRALTFTCGTCGGRFESGELLKWHELEHLRAADGKYCCDHCDSKFVKREQLLGHRRFHFKDKNVECPKCGKKFMTTGMLTMHNKWKHSQGPCRFCGRPFTSATARQAHEEHMHLKHMMHMCDVCHFRVMAASQLRVHKRTHSAETPHRCPDCEQAFVSKNVLRKHRAQQHAEELPPATVDGGAASDEPSASQSGGEDQLTLSDLDTTSDEDERRDQLDIEAKEALFKKKDKNTFSIWSCPVCKAFFTKLWGVRAHITLKHPGASVRPVLHDDKDTSAANGQA